MDYADKTVAVIGTGSSAIQIVPQVQKKAKHVTAFMRSVTWISPVVGDADLEAEKHKHHSQSDREPQDKGELAKRIGTQKKTSNVFATTQSTYSFTVRS